jgi:hypothetical protein
MTMLRLKPMIVVIPVIACAVLLIALAAPAAAQSAACVHLQPGSSFLATMTVRAVDGTTVGPSTSFASGHTQCLPLDTIMDGRGFTVVVQATSGGGSANCQPTNNTRAADLSASVTFNATGTPQNIFCAAPAAPAAATPEAACGQFSIDVFPNGTYSNSCVDCELDVCTLNCLCAIAGASTEDCDLEGFCNRTMLDLSGCNASQDISNQNGVLTCTPL